MSFAGDEQMLIDLNEYRKQYDYKHIIETGTFRGESTTILSEMFDHVYTCDVIDYYDRGRTSFDNYPNVNFVIGTSPDCLPGFYDLIGDDNFYLFLDAHDDVNNPILDELQTLIDRNLKPFIIIHDFDCGHEGWRFNHPLTFEYVKPKMDLIYGEGNYVFEVSQISKNGLDHIGQLNQRGCGFFYLKN